MIKIKRYDIVENPQSIYGGVEEVEDENGGYVKYEDIKHLSIVNLCKCSIGGITNECIYYDKKIRRFN